MSQKEKQYMPQSTAGIMRYMDVDQGIRVKPHHVIAVSLAFGIVIMVLKFLA